MHPMTRATLLVGAIAFSRGAAAEPKSVDVAEEGDESLSTARYASGSVVGTVFGLGSGHVIQGRWLTSGWKYTLGEVGFAGLALSALSAGAHCEDRSCNTRTAVLGVVGLTGFAATRIASTIDLWSAPHGQKDGVAKVQLALVPIKGAASAGVRIRW